MNNIKNIITKASVRLLLTCSAVLLGNSITVQAESLAQYTFDSGTVASGDLNPDSIAGSFTLGGALGAGSAGFDSASGSAFALSSVTPDSLALAISGGSYFSFTLTADVGYVVNISSLSFNTVYDGSLSSGILTANYTIRSSLDGFSTNLATFSEVYQPASSSAFTFRNIDLSSNALYQSITGTTEFRIYVYDNSTSASRLVRLDDVTLSGSTSVIPEPSTLASLFGCITLLVASSSRRCRRNGAGNQ